MIIKAGDSVLISEISGLVWHTVTRVLGNRITTNLCPQDFSISFVVRVVREI